MSLLVFSLVTCVFTYAVLRLQGHLALNPDHLGGVSPGLSFNTAISFLTGTNWQSYAGESTMSPLSQMLALTIHQFLAGAVGMAVAVALIRALIRRRQRTLGSFWVDVVRGLTRVLIPLSFIFAVILMSQGASRTSRAAATFPRWPCRASTRKGSRFQRSRSLAVRSPR